MFTSHPLRRSTVVTALALALLGVTLSGPAAARVPVELQTSSLAGTTSTPRQDLRSPDAIDAARQDKVALAMERYSKSYGKPKPLFAKAQAHAPAHHDTPVLPIGIALAAALAVIAASATHLRRLRLRRRTAGALS